MATASNRSTTDCAGSSVGGDAVRKHLFEQFWTSGAPLIGEEGCVGWHEWAAQKQHLRAQPDLPAEEPGAHLTLIFQKQVHIILHNCPVF